MRGPVAMRLWLPVAIAFLAAALLTGMLVGPVDLGAVNVVRATFAHLFGLHSPLSGADDAILWELRLPRVVLGAIVGGTLAAAGAAYQGVFRNPLADPYLLGAAAGAGLGATLIAAYAPASAFDGDLLPVAAFVGASVAVVAAYVLGRSAGGAAGPAALVLAGVTVASFFTALQTFVQQQNVETVQEV
jgi:iron complex transport system permease protein